VTPNVRDIWVPSPGLDQLLDFCEGHANLIFHEEFDGAVGFFNEEKSVETFPVGYYFLINLFKVGQYPLWRADK
jgi:hypothetical protein